MVVRTHFRCVWCVRARAVRRAGTRALLPAHHPLHDRPCVRLCAAGREGKEFGADISVRDVRGCVQASRQPRDRSGSLPPLFAPRSVTPASAREPMEHSAPAFAGTAPGGADEVEASEAERDTEIYDDYSCRSLCFGVPHPSEIAEPRGLASVSLPAPSYPLRDSLDRCNNIVDAGLLSSLQLEGVQFACQRHQLMLSSGTRAGFFLGDGAGVGKGRQIAGMIADNLARGRCRMPKSAHLHCMPMLCGSDCA